MRNAAHRSTGPQSLEAYHQESGRAGRDGMPARCVIFAPMTTLPSVLPSRGRSSEAQAACTEMLRACHEYAIQTSNCRRQMLLCHFGERFEPDDRRNARCCDVCDRVTGRLQGAECGHLTSEPEALIQPAARMIRRAYRRSGCAAQGIAILQLIESGLIVALWCFIRLRGRWCNGLGQRI